MIPRRRIGDHVSGPVALMAAGIVGLLAALALAGCAYCSQAAHKDDVQCKIISVAKDCGGPAVVKLVIQILPTVVAALLSPDPSSALTALEQSLTANGWTDAQGLIVCAVQVAGSNAAPPGAAAMSPEAHRLHDAAAAWLKAHGK